MQGKVYNHIVKNRFYYVFFIFLISVGMAGGIISSVKLSQYRIEDISAWLHLSEANGGWSAFFKALYVNLQSIAVIWLSGFHVFLMPLCFAMLAWRGFEAGFAIGIVIRLSGIGGVAYALLGVLIPICIYVIMLMAASLLSVKTSIKALKNKQRLSKNGAYHLKNAVRMLGILAISILGCVWQGWLSPLFTSLIK